MDECLTLEQVAEFLQVTAPTVYKEMKNGLPARRVGRSWRFSKCAVCKWLDHDNSHELITASEARAARKANND